jgi:crossover junction endodeoxyribonuclease RusA
VSAETIGFWVEGKPETKGSTRAFVVGGRARITNDNPRAKGWAALVTRAARQAMSGSAPLDGAVKVRLLFAMPRPAAHWRTRGGKPTQDAKANAPDVPTTRPDVDKLVRCALDALTGVVFRDDTQVVELYAQKFYERLRMGPGVMVAVEPAGGA